VNTTIIRRWHSYLGLFIAPSVLFFSITGAVQLFNLHEAHGTYRPPALVEKLSTVHKDQAFALGDHHPEAAPEDGTATDAKQPAVDDSDRTSLATQLVKWFFLLIALCLMVSTVVGLWIGLTLPHLRRFGWLLVAAGALIPTILLCL
jgi:hypothetical protein